MLNGIANLLANSIANPVVITKANTFANMRTN